MAVLTKSSNATRHGEKKLSAREKMFGSILNILNDPRFIEYDAQKKLPILVYLYEKLNLENKKKKKENKWRYG